MSMPPTLGTTGSCRLARANGLIYVEMPWSVLRYQRYSILCGSFFRRPGEKTTARKESPTLPQARRILAKVLLKFLDGLVTNQINENHRKKGHGEEQHVRNCSRAAQLNRAPICEGLQRQRLGGGAWPAAGHHIRQIHNLKSFDHSDQDQGCADG